MVFFICILCFYSNKTTSNHDNDQWFFYNSSVLNYQVVTYVTPTMVNLEHTNNVGNSYNSEENWDDLPTLLLFSTEIKEVLLIYKLWLDFAHKCVKNFGGHELFQVSEFHS